jgi:hypothetical protein
MSAKTKLKLIAVILLVPASFICGWLFGVNDGVNTGYKVAYLEMDNLLREGVSGGVKFSIRGLNARFVPRPDKALMYMMSGVPSSQKPDKHKM